MPDMGEDAMIKTDEKLEEIRKLEHDEEWRRLNWWFYFFVSGFIVGTIGIFVSLLGLLVFSR